MADTGTASATDADALAERPHLLAIAYRMLGTSAEAEDAVQDTYARWFRLPPAERDAVLSPRGWLVRATSRVCLDALGSARARRERYVGPWLPEPAPADAFVPSAADPLERAALRESVGTALLLVLETMTPAERAVFVLHDAFGMPFPEIAEAVDRSPAACRQLASSGRRKLRAGRRRTASRAEHDQVVRAFAAAAAGGELSALVAVLAPDVVLVSDGGGRVSAARRPVAGADRVARLLLGLAEKNPGTITEAIATGDGLGFLLRAPDGAVHGVITLSVSDGAVSELRMVRNPEKLTRWGEGMIGYTEPMSPIGYTP